MKASISPVLWVFLLSALLVAAPARGQDSSAENPPGDAVGTALNTFAFALYRQLASENEGENPGNTGQRTTPSSVAAERTHPSRVIVPVPIRHQTSNQTARGRTEAKGCRIVSRSIDSTRPQTGRIGMKRGSR